MSNSNSTNYKPQTIYKLQHKILNAWINAGVRNLLPFFPIRTASIPSEIAKLEKLVTVILSSELIVTAANKWSPANVIPAGNKNACSPRPHVKVYRW